MSTTAVQLRSEKPSHRKPVRDESEERLFHRYRSQDDLVAREELFRRFQPLAQRLAKHYQGGGEPLEDLVQVAGMGLVKAIDRFDAERGTPFVGYAIPTITGELKRYFRDASWALHLPRGLQERVLQISKAVSTLSNELGSSPSPGQIAAHTGLPTEEVLQALEAATAHDALSLDAALPSDKGREVTYAETVGAIDPRFEIIEAKVGLRGGLRVLPEREQMILYLRFIDGLTQAEIGERIGISQMHVSRLLHRALDRLHTIAQAA